MNAVLFMLHVPPPATLHNKFIGLLATK